MGRALLASLIMAAGACVQGAVGFGSNIVAAPLLVLVDPVFVPGPISIASATLNLLILRRREGRPDPGIRWALVGLGPGTVVAAFTLAALPADALSILFAVIVLAAVVLTASGLSVPHTRNALTGAGVASGFMGTVSGISGPPVALAYQHASGPTLRATLPRYFLVASALTLGALAAVGKLGWAELRAGVELLPGTLAGFLASGALTRHVDGRAARPIVLLLSTIAAVGVLLRELV
jgi:uncharacterized membrane protein YfcA